MECKYDASMMSDTSKPPSESEGGTIVEDPVGLLNIYEYNMSGYRQGFLNNSLQWWTLTPIDTTAIYHVLAVVESAYGTFLYSFGIRPSINLKPEIKIVDGNGTEENPYRLMGDNDTNLSGTKLNTRYSGEYISYGTGEKNL